MELEAGDAADALGIERLQGRRFYVGRAQESIDAAQAEPLVQRKHIHLEAARRWTALAEKAAFVEARKSERMAN